MIDLTGYPWLATHLRGGYSSPHRALQEFELLITEVRQAERERCRQVCLDYQLPDWSEDTVETRPRYNRENDPSLVAYDCAAAIEELGDDDG